MSTAERTAEEAWREVQRKAQERMDSDQPVFSPDKRIQSQITAVTETAIRRISRSSRSDPEKPASQARRTEVEKTWNQLVRHGTGGKGTLKFVIALLLLLDGVRYNPQTKLLELDSTTRRESGDRPQE